MKGKMLLKIFGVLSAACILFSCNPEKPSPEGKKSLSPPAWIQGSWEDERQLFRYTFTENSIIYIVNTAGVNATFDFLKDYKIMGEEESEGKYSISYQVLLAVEANEMLADTTRIEFTQINETTLTRVSYYDSSGEGSSGIEFIKK